MSITISTGRIPAGERRLGVGVPVGFSTRSSMQRIHEDLARAQIRARVRSAERDRPAAQLVRARRLSRKGAALRARLGARFA